MSELRKINKYLTSTLTGIYSKMSDFNTELLTRISNCQQKIESMSLKNEVEQFELTGTAADNDDDASPYGKKVFITDDLWKVVITIMAGIEMSVRAFDYEKKQYNNSDKDFLTKNTFEIQLGFERYKKTEFLNYAPKVFAELRQCEGINSEQFVESLGASSFWEMLTGNVSTLKGMSSTGKSGSFFFTSSDHKYLVKTIRKYEFKFLLGNLVKYKSHIDTHATTLLSRIYGLYSINLIPKSGRSDKLFIIVMQNVMESGPFTIVEKYDLKGSTYKRNTKVLDFRVAPGKDLDFISRMNNSAKVQSSKLRLPKEMYAKVVDRLTSDAKFLKENGIIDYSLLIGMIDTKSYKAEVDYPQMRQHIKSLPAEKGLIKQTMNRGALFTSDGRYLIMVGIIDYLTVFGSFKKLESSFKRIIFGNGVSCVPPMAYSQRFVNFLKENVFEPDNEKFDIESMGFKLEKMLKVLK